VIRHVVLIKWKDETDPAQVEAVESALAEMPVLMPFIRRYDMGTDLGVNGSHVFAIVADFESIEDYRTYADHPDHKAASATFIAPILESMARVQFTV
jgi:hypothetical protein